MLGLLARSSAGAALAPGSSSSAAAVVGAATRCLRCAVASSSQSSSPSFSTSAAARNAAADAGEGPSKQRSVSVAIPAPREGVTDPKSFLQSISRGPRRVLHENTAALSALGESWEEMWGKVLNGQPAGTPPDRVGGAPGAASPRAGKLINRDLRANGVAVKDRRYILWALEKYRQGLDPREYAIKPKPKKKIRGWGPRVQNGIRVRGRRRPGEK